MSPGRNHILACSDGLEWPQLAPFVRSVRLHAPAALLVLFVARISPETRRALGAHQVALIPLDALFPDAGGRTPTVRKLLWRGAVFLHRFLRYSIFRRRLLQRAGGLLLPRNQARFFHYSAFLEECGSPGDRFLFCDARDVVFQSDPFALMPADGVVLTEENPRITLRDNPYNTRWYAETYGPGQLLLHASRTIACAGVFGGERDALLHFLDLFIVESTRRPCAYGADQAILNRLLYTGASGDIRLLANQDSLAWHLYGVPSEEITVTPSAIVSQPGGHVPPVLHMFDRHPEVARRIQAHWSGS